MGSVAAPQTLPTGRASDAGSYRGPQAAVAVVASADCWMAQTHLAWQRGLSRVARDHLPQSFHSGTGCIEERVAGAFTAHPGHASFAPSHAENGRSWPDPRRGIDQ